MNTNYPSNTIAILHVHHTSAFTEDIPYSEEEPFLRTLNEYLDLMGPMCVSAEVCDQSDLGLRYRVHTCYCDNLGQSAMPEKLWHIKSTLDKNIDKKLSALLRYERGEGLEHTFAAKLDMCEIDAGVRPELMDALSEESICEIVGAFYSALPSSYRKKEPLYIYPFPNSAGADC